MKRISKHPSRIGRRRVALALGSLAAASACPSHAAEDFQVRYNIAGSLGGEMFAPPDATGWLAGAALTSINIWKVSGSDGRDLKTTVSGGSVPLATGGTPLDPTYASQSVTVKAKGPLEMLNVALGYVTPDHFGGGRLAFAVNLPFGYKKQTIAVLGATPQLNWPIPGAPDDATRAAVGSAFGAQYQDGLAAQGAAQSGNVTGLGDVELMAGWLRNTEHWRLLAGASLVAPTGKYNVHEGVDFGFGNYYTLRPAIQVAYLPTDDWAIAGKLSFGINTRNRDDSLRSGNWVGMEGAVGYKTPWGPFGLHAVHIQQIQDDSGNSLGAARFRSTNAGLFFTTKLPVSDIVITAQTMVSVDSRYAKHGSFNQIRLLKAF